MERMASCFDETGFACYLWIIGKVTSKFGEAAIGPGGDALAGLLGGAFENVTQVLGRRLGEKTAVEMPDGESFPSLISQPCPIPFICFLVILSSLDLLNSPYRGTSRLSCRARIAGRRAYDPAQLSM
jgi:hypothetical protein